MIGTQAGIIAGRDAWSEHLREIFSSLNLPDDATTEHLIASVAQYCLHYHPQGVHRADLVLLIARAFCTINDRSAAAIALRSVKPHARHVDRWLEILSELHHFPKLLPYFSLGIIRPADWVGAQLDRMWTLDLGRFVLSEAEKHEMMLYRSLRSIMENMYVFWDATGGEGVLGLSGLDSFNVESGEERQTCTSSGDLIGYVENLLSQQKNLRRWSSVPAVMNLDL